MFHLTCNPFWNQLVKFFYREKNHLRFPANWEFSIYLTRDFFFRLFLSLPSTKNDVFPVWVIKGRFGHHSKRGISPVSVRNWKLPRSSLTGFGSCYDGCYYRANHSGVITGRWFPRQRRGQPCDDVSNVTRALAPRVRGFQNFVNYLCL